MLELEEKGEALGLRDILGVTLEDTVVSIEDREAPENGTDTGAADNDEEAS